MSTTPLSLFELNSLVEDTLRLTLPQTFWVTAEISSIHVANNGHCYLELVERKNDIAIRAKASAHIWNNTYQLIAPYFEKKTGCALVAGIKILAEVEINFHSLYGYSLNIVDIDPSYTMGDLAQKKREIIQQLTDDGIIALNKEVPIPVSCLRIAVISSDSAAGYGDFCHQLVSSPFKFEIKLFSSIMQGEDTEKGIIAALDLIMNDLQNQQWDIVAIIRGGGASSDLHGFDTYTLAAHVAQFPIPILTGIGHQRDETIVDVVAHQSFKTPTAVAAFLVEKAEHNYQQLLEYEKQLERTIQSYFEKQHRIFLSYGQWVQQAISRFSAKELAKLVHFETYLSNKSVQIIQTAALRLENNEQKLTASTLHLLERENRRLKDYQRTLQMMSPERILKLGYSITTLPNGKIVRSPEDLQVGDEVITTLERGTITSKVQSLSQKYGKK